MKEIYIIRHGETDQNVRGIVQGSGIDSSLNEKGETQAKKFHDHYSETPFDLIIASNLKRTNQTIQHFINEHIPFEIDSRIREISWGEHEGKAGDPELMKKYYRILKAWKSGNLDARPIDGESAMELQLRLNLFLKDLQTKTFKKALICTHGRTLRALICLLKSWPLSKMEEVEHSNTGLYHCIYNDEKWQLEKENDLTHLKIQNSFNV